MVVVGAVLRGRGHVQVHQGRRAVGHGSVSGGNVAALPLDGTMTVVVAVVATVVAIRERMRERERERKISLLYFSVFLEIIFMLVMHIKIIIVRSRKTAVF